MTALIAGRHRAGRGNATPETRRVVDAFRDAAATLGRAPTFAELHDAPAARRIAVTPERLRVHLAIARLRVREGAL